MRSEDEPGFTLIELLVVIVILGILAAIVVFAVGGITDKGQTAACDTEKKTIQTAEEAYYAHFKTGSTYTTTANLVTQKYLADAPTNLQVASGAADANGYTITKTTGSPC